jgi:signal transduction histidine kinase
MARPVRESWRSDPSQPASSPWLPLFAGVSAAAATALLVLQPERWVVALVAAIAAGLFAAAVAYTFEARHNYQRLIGNPTPQKPAPWTRSRRGAYATDLATDSLRNLGTETQARLDLIGTVSHEMRTPLTAVLGYVKLLRDEAFDPEEARQMLEIIAEQSEDLMAIVEDLLTAAQASAGKLEVKPHDIDLGEETRTVVASMQRRTESPMWLNLHPAPIMADASRVRQIVRNLLSNALVHGGDNIGVEIDVEGEQARVTVSDDGPGLGDRNPERAFNAFESGTNGEHKPGSVGLGLAISRYLARAMGGDLVYDRMNNTTRFTLTLPTD